MAIRKVARKKKEPETKTNTQAKKESRKGEVAGAMQRPSGDYDNTAHVLTAREIAESKRKRKKKK